MPSLAKNLLDSTSDNIVNTKAKTQSQADTIFLISIISPSPDYPHSSDAAYSLCLPNVHDEG